MSYAQLRTSCRTCSFETSEMLASLFRQATGYKGSTSLESATDDAHTGNLLFGQSQNIFTLSPPVSPFGSPTFRPGSFDDRGSLDVEEKDLRILIAQDAFGSQERPTLLFDSKPGSGVKPSSEASQTKQRIPLPVDWKPGHTVPDGSSKETSFRSRSSTISGAPNSWTRPTRDVETREDAFLECMFGVTSSVKSTSTIKMHVIPGQPKPLPFSDRRSVHSPDSPDPPQRRAPLVRSRTSMHQPKPPSLDADHHSDVVLITRLFGVTLPEKAQVVETKAESSKSSIPEAESASTTPIPTPTEASPAPKRAKLVERKVPAFAIGLVLQLPRSDTRPRSSQYRPWGPPAHSHTLSTPPSSIDSDLHSSWTFLDAIPDSMSSSRSSNEDADKRVSAVVNNWDAILRSIAAIEHEARDIIYNELLHVLSQVSDSTAKMPKEKSMQRINQRIIAINEPARVASSPRLQALVRHAVHRMTHALRVPRVVTGQGLITGHWADEARMLNKLFGSKQQNFFLLNLLTAFLSNHTEWLHLLAPEWHRRQFHQSLKRQRRSQALLSRTVILSDQKGLARRLVYLLASFLPNTSGADLWPCASEDGGQILNLSTSSPSGPSARTESLRRGANRRSHVRQRQAGVSEPSALSTSASSADSAVAVGASHRILQRTGSEVRSVRKASLLPIPDSDGFASRATAASTSAVTSNPTTPVAYFSTARDSYFPDGATLEASDSAASADLAKVLRSNSSSFGNSSPSSSRWGSLVSGLTDIWGQRQSSAHAGRTFKPSASAQSSRSVDLPPCDSNTLEDMVKEADQLKKLSLEEHQPVVQDEPSRTDPIKSFSLTPKLSVDSTDGVVDVELDLPGFVRLGPLEHATTSPSKNCCRSPPLGRDGAESIRSRRSVASPASQHVPAHQPSVAGYLREYQEDFTLLAVKPYADFDADLKRAMSLEVANLETADHENMYPSVASGMTDLCTTLIADTRTHTVRRVTLRGKIDAPVSRPQSAQTTPLGQPSGPSRPISTWEEFVEEDILDFDNTLADAVDKVLTINSSLDPKATPSLRSGHTRHTSSGSASTARSIPRPSVESQSVRDFADPSFLVRQDCRQVMAVALEQIVKSVNDGLSKAQKASGGQPARNLDGSALPAEPHQENVLREGVKKWLLNVEQMRVW